MKISQEDQQNHTIYRRRETKLGWLVSWADCYFVKLETDTGIIGWREAYALSNRQLAIRETILSLGEALKQMDGATPRGFLLRVAKPMDRAPRSLGDQPLRIKSSAASAASATPAVSQTAETPQAASAAPKIRGAAACNTRAGAFSQPMRCP